VVRVLIIAIIDGRTISRRTSTAAAVPARDVDKAGIAGGTPTARRGSAASISFAPWVSVAMAFGNSTRQMWIAGEFVGLLVRKVSGATGASIASQVTATSRAFVAVPLATMASWMAPR